MQRGKRLFDNKIIRQKTMFSMMIATIFILGRNIPLPLIDIQAVRSSMASNALADAAAMASGGDFSQMSIFSLGLGPYMSTMIIWRFISMSERFKKRKLNKKQTDRRRYMLTMVIAIIQSLSILSNIELSQLAMETVNSAVIGRVLLVLFLVTGTFFLIWLANQNVVKGFGNTTLIIIIGILLRLPIGSEAFRSLFNSLTLQETSFAVFGILGAFVIIIMGIVLVDRSEIRLPLRRVMIKSDFKEKSYLPIKLNPAGGMPIMYSMSLLALPNYLFGALRYVWPDNQWLEWLQSNIQMDTVTGVILYCVMIFALSIGFAHVNINPEQLAKQLRKQGDFIEQIRPGPPTQAYIQYIISRVGIVGATFNTLVSGVPMALTLKYPMYSDILTIPMSLLILVSMCLMIFDEVNSYYLMGKYDSLFDF